MLQGEGQYNLNTLKEIEVTESFLQLDQHQRGCQTLESYENCTTREHLNIIRKECGCLPYSLGLNDQVIKIVRET